MLRFKILHLILLKKSNNETDMHLNCYIQAITLYPALFSYQLRALLVSNVVFQSTLHCLDRQFVYIKGKLYHMTILFTCLKYLRNTLNNNGLGFICINLENQVLAATIAYPGD